MYKIDRTLYAGITNENGLNFINEYEIKNTGYSIQRITDGEILGLSYEMKGYEVESMFIEIEYDVEIEEKDKENIVFEKNRIIIAGVYNEVGFDLCVNRENLYTGKKFVRIHDGQEMGNIIYLGMDYSYNRNKPRFDLSTYYYEVEDNSVLINDEENNY